MNYVISKTGVQRCALSDVFIFHGHDAGHVAQAEGGQTADNREGQAGDQPATAQMAADAANQRQFCERTGSVCLLDVCAGGVQSAGFGEIPCEDEKGVCKDWP